MQYGPVRLSSLVSGWIRASAQATSNARSKGCPRVRIHLLRRPYEPLSCSFATRDHDGAPWGRESLELLEQSRGYRALGPAPQRRSSRSAPSARSVTTWAAGTTRGDLADPLPGIQRHGLDVAGHRSAGGRDEPPRDRLRPAGGLNRGDHLVRERLGCWPPPVLPRRGRLGCGSVRVAGLWGWKPRQRSG